MKRYVWLLVWLWTRVKNLSKTTIKPYEYLINILNLQVQSKVKDECDNNYSIRVSEKDENSPHRIASRRRDSLNHPQRSSASPTSNIWLRLIEDEENIGNVIYQYLVFTSRFDLLIPHRTSTTDPHFDCPAYPSPHVHVMLPTRSRNLTKTSPLKRSHEINLPHNQ